MSEPMVDLKNCPFCGDAPRFIDGTGQGDCQIFCPNEYNGCPGPFVQERTEDLAKAVATWNRRPTPSADGPFIDIVFDGPPSHESGRFVEVEDSAGRSIEFGQWLQRPDGYWVLRIGAPASATDGLPAALRHLLASIDQEIRVGTPLLASTMLHAEAVKVALAAADAGGDMRDRALEEASCLLKMIRREECVITLDLLDIGAWIEKYEALAALKSYPEEGGWRSMDSAPVNGAILGYDERIGWQRIILHMNDGKFMALGSGRVFNATHWRPLPSPPVPEQEGRPDELRDRREPPHD